MLLAQKMLQQNGITPSSTTTPPTEPANPTGGEGQEGIGKDGDDPAKVVANAGGGTGDHPLTEPDDAAIIAALGKRGLKVTSLEELVNPTSPTVELTQEQKEALEQKRQNDIRSYALQAGKVTTTQLDSYVRESSIPAVDLAFQIYKQDILAEEQAAGTPTENLPTDEEIRADFDEINYLKANETDPKRKAAEKRIAKMVDSHLKNKYAPVYSLEADYNQNQQSEALRNTYNATVDEALSSIEPDFTFEITDNNQKITYPVKLSADDINTIKTLYTGDDMFHSIGSKGVKKDSLTASMKNSIILKNLNAIINEVANAHADAKIKAIKMGRREIFSSTNTGEATSNKVVSKGVQKILDRNNISTPA